MSGSAGRGALLAALIAASGCGESAAPRGGGASADGIAPGVELPPGWGVEFEWTSPGGAGSRSVRTFSPSAAFAVFPAQAPHPLVSPTDFSATYSARVLADAPGRYRFGVESAGGGATIAVYDGSARKVGEAAASGGGSGPSFTPWIELSGSSPGAALSVRFTRAGETPARLRTWWEREGPGEKGFMAEPIPPGAARVPAFAAPAAAAGILEQRGRVRIGELGCTHCHAPPPAPVIGGDGHGTHASNPALPHSLAPVLGAVGGRASAGWLRRWIADPQTLSPGSGMPDLFAGGPTDEADVDALVHFLVSIAPQRPDPVAAGASTGTAAPAGDEIDRGRRLYHTVGCVVCHGAKEPPASAFADASLASAIPAAPAPVPFADLKGKWGVAALAEFLLNPGASRPQGRMPGMALSPPEARDLAAYLTMLFGAGDDGTPVAPDPERAARGRRVYTSRGCASCHTLGPAWTRGEPLKEIVSTLRPRGIASMRSGAGCLDPKDAGSPRYTLTDADRRAIEAGLETVRRTAAGASAAPIDAGRMVLETLACRRCHETEGTGGPDEGLRAYFRDHAGIELGDEGRFPPRLTGVGWKLNTPWMRDVLMQAGRARPYMSTRMPQFGDPRIVDLAETLAAMDGLFATMDEPDPEPTDERVLAGRRLVGDAGLNCITCHVVGDLPPVGTPGPDLRRLTERNRFEWWRRYVANPPRFKTGTRMPSFFATGRGTVTDVLGGDPVPQTEAIWAYLSLGERMPLPPGVGRASGALRIGDRPVVLRGFLGDAGSRGIAVGFPAGLHFAFDAESCRLVGAWRGGFPDASGSRSGRAGDVFGGAWRAFTLTGDEPLAFVAEFPP